MLKQLRYCKYLRYSKVHGDKEPDSIYNQKRIIADFVVEKSKTTNTSWILHDIYVDIDYTGTNFMRPDFLRMKKDIEAGKINVVISKDCSRFGRNIATEVYFSEIFPKYGTYFIGVIDNIDTSNESQVLERQIRGMMNENYSRDISLKVRSALYAMMSEGKYVGGNPPYGFIRDPNDKHRLLVDENVRHVILRIADLYLQGNGFQTVAKILNDDQDSPPAPSLYKKMRGSKGYSENAWRGLWSVSTVRKILTEEIYNGTLVQGKVQRVSFKVRDRVSVPDEARIKVEDAVEKIIDDETWALIQKRIRARSKSVGSVGNRDRSISPHNFYSGVLFCEDCGARMSYRSDRNVYCCATYAGYGKKYCSSHYIKSQKINKLLIKQIRIINKLTIDIKRLDDNIKKRFDERKNTNITLIKVKQHQRRIVVIKETLKMLREERAAGDISDQEYKKMRNEYSDELMKLQKKLGKLSERVNNSEEMVFQWWDKKIKNIEEMYEKYFSIKELNRELVVRLVEKITVNKNREISKIVFRGESPFELAKELKTELESTAVG